MGIIDGLDGRLSVISRSGMVGGVVAFLGREELSRLVVQLFSLHRLFAFLLGRPDFILFWDKSEVKARGRDEVR